MKRAILFRFHKNAEVCADRLALLRTLNPTVPIYGLYGGSSSDLPALARALDPYFDDIYEVNGVPGIWKWLHGDMLYRAWFRDRGHALEFDQLVIAEWDLVLAAPFDELYAKVPPGALGLTGLVPLDDVQHDWPWAQSSWWLHQYRQLLDGLREHYGYEGTPRICQGPGWIWPRAFLEAYTAMDVPLLSHEEGRPPVIAEALGFEVVDNGFFGRWFDAADDAIFNCDNDEIPVERIRHELLRTHGRRAFHPVREVLRSRLATTIVPPTTARDTKVAAQQAA